LHKAVRQIKYALIQCCREKKRLTLFWRLSQNALNRLGKAHIEHTIGLIEHKHLKPRKVNLALLHKINKAPRRCDEYIVGLCELFELNAVGHSPNNTSRFEAIHKATVLLCLRSNLLSEFAGGD